MIVLKFGGTSVGNLDRVRDAASIIEAQPLPRAAVVSAASGVTNMLLESARIAAAGDGSAATEIVSTIEAKHFAIIAGIASPVERESTRLIVESLHEELRTSLDAVAAAGVVSSALSDRIVSIGERSMSVIVAATLRDRGTPAAHVFANQVIATDDRHGNARPDRHLTREQADAVVRPLLDDGQTVVMTGFIGGARMDRSPRSAEAVPTTAPRSSARLSWLTRCRSGPMCQVCSPLIPVWSSMPVSCPRSVSTKRRSSPTSGQVLHPRTIRPAVALDIPVRILSTFAPLEPGTLVTREATGQHLKAVTVMRGLQLLTVDVPELEISLERRPGLWHAVRGSRRGGAGIAGFFSPPDDLFDRWRCFGRLRPGAGPPGRFTAGLRSGRRLYSRCGHRRGCWSWRRRRSESARSATGRAGPGISAGARLQSANIECRARRRDSSEFAERALQAVHDEFIRPSPGKRPVSSPAAFGSDG